MGNRLAALLAAMCLPFAAEAQVPEPGEPAARFVAQVSEALFDLLPTENHAKARAFFAPELERMLSEDDWTTVIGQLRAEAGFIPRYRAHGLSFYPQADQLIAAVDFSGAGKDGAVICGYLAWSMPDAERTVADRAIGGAAGHHAPDGTGSRRAIASVLALSARSHREYFGAFQSPMRPL